MDNEFVQIANILADEAGKIARQYFRQRYQTTSKEDKSPVTEADQAIELKMRSIINELLPNHGIYGEEYGQSSNKNDYCWVLDPIDGTASFICGKPSFTTLISLLYKNKPILGIIDQPILNERWIGIEGERTLFNGQPILTTMNPNIIRLSCTTPQMFKDEDSRTLFEQVRQIATTISYGGDGYAYGLLASGYIDIIMEDDLKLYDIAALIPIIEGTGCMISDWQGNILKLDNFQGKCLAVRDKSLQDKILELLNPEL